MEPILDNKQHKIIFILILACALFFGNALAGWFISHGIYKSRSADRYVSVKGIAERQVKADIAIWEIGYKITGDDLNVLTTNSEKNQKIIVDFLIRNGFATNEIEQQRINVVDLFAREYSSNKPPYRYIINCGVILRTPNVDLVRQISQKSSELIQQGIVLTNRNDYLPNPRYFFTKLDEIRPKMLEQATKSARLVAEQFAINSGSKIGPIRRASQGVFQILNIDSNAGQNYGSDNDQIGDINKTVRIVVSLDYILKS